MRENPSPKKDGRHFQRLLQKNLAISEDEPVLLKGYNLLGVSGDQRVYAPKADL